MVEEQEAQIEHDEAQVIEGYGCICGFKTEDANELRVHVMRAALVDGKGTHKSLGRINMQTGEVIMPPWNKRTKEQKQRSKNGRHTQEVRTGSKDTVAPPIKTTDSPAVAQQLRFVPRVYTTDYSPIIRAAQDAAVEFWGWPIDMSLGDFLDTALHFLFKEHGIILAGYTISDEAREALEEQKAREAEEAQKVVEEV